MDSPCTTLDRTSGAVSGLRKRSAMRKQIAVDLAKSVYQIAESVRAGQVSQRKWLNREAFCRYIQEQAEAVEWLMEACGTGDYRGRFAQVLGHR